MSSAEQYRRSQALLLPATFGSIYITAHPSGRIMEEQSLCYSKNKSKNAFSLHAGSMTEVEIFFSLSLLYTSPTAGDNLLLAVNTDIFSLNSKRIWPLTRNRFIYNV